MDRMIKSGFWNFLLLVFGQVNGQNPLVQTRITCPKNENFSYFKKETYTVGTC